MINRPTLFACVIAAAIGCRSDRDDRSVQYGGSPAAAGVPTSESMGERTQPLPPSVPSTGLVIEVDRAGAGDGAHAGVPVEGDTSELDDRDTRTDEAGRARAANEPRGERELEPTPVKPDTGRRVQVRRPRPEPVLVVPPAAPPTVPSGTSETASGHGTPTNTGINTENAGTGG
jgi:hypothetical protein